MIARRVSMFAVLVAGIGAVGGGAEVAAAAEIECATSQTVRDTPPSLTPSQLQLALTPAPAATGPFDIVIVPGPGLAGNPAALAAFERAAAQWEQKITDPIRVTINANFAQLGANILGQASSATLEVGYAAFRNMLVTDASNEVRDSLVASLPAGNPAFALPGGVVYNGLVVGTKANYKAAGFSNLDQMFGASDAQITFNSRFTFDFDFDNRDGVPANAIDFESVAAHEIGHALGFVSEVDSVDFGDTSVGAAPLDLFRFQNGGSADPRNAGEFAAFARELRPGIEANFDDTRHGLLRLSTGSSRGDGRQASHWKDDTLFGGFLIGVMDPVADVQISPVRTSDVLLLDLIGYEVLVAEEAPGILVSINGDPLGPVTVASGAIVSLGALAADMDGLGFPIFFGSGNPGRVSTLWEFAGAAPLSGDFSGFILNPLARFSLSPGQTSRTFNVSFGAIDTLGDNTVVPVPIRVVPPTPPSVTVQANGQTVSGPLSVRSGAQIQFVATASDPDGLGYPFFNVFGSNNDLTFLWEFGGATALNGDLSIFSDRPLVRFDLAPGQSSRTFQIVLNTLDALGAQRITNVTVNVTR